MTDSNNPNVPASPPKDYYSTLVKLIGEVSRDPASLRNLVYAMARRNLKPEAMPNRRNEQPPKADPLPELENALELERAIERVEAGIAQSEQLSDLTKQDLTDHTDTARHTSPSRDGDPPDKPLGNVFIALPDEFQCLAPTTGPHLCHASAEVARSRYPRVTGLGGLRAARATANPTGQTFAASATRLRLGPWRAVLHRRHRLDLYGSATDLRANADARCKPAGPLQRRFQVELKRSSLRSSRNPFCRFRCQRPMEC